MVVHEIFTSYHCWALHCHWIVLIIFAKSCHTLSLTGHYRSLESMLFFHILTMLVPWESVSVSSLPRRTTEGTVWVDYYIDCYDLMLGAINISRVYYHLDLFSINLKDRPRLTSKWRVLQAWNKCEWIHMKHTVYMNSWGHNTQLADREKRKFSI